MGTAQDGDFQEIGVEDARLIARQAVLNGDLGLANAVSTALLQRDPEDANALIVRAIVLRASGDLPAAADAAAAAYRNAEEPSLRFDAALFAADIATRRERYTRSQIWLRLADQAAPDEERQRLVEQAYRAVDRRNPLSIRLQFSITPSNNVNNGAEETIININGFPFSIAPSAQQLGGTIASSGLTLGWRLSENQTQRTELVGDVIHRNVWLDDEAKEIAPDAKGSDFDYTALTFGVRHERIIWSDLGPTEFTGLVGQSWYGGEDFARWGELRLGQVVNREDMRLRFGATVREENRLDDDINDSTTLALSASMTRPLGEGLFTLSGSVRNVWSDSATVDHFGFGVSGTYSFAELSGFLPRVSASADSRNYHLWEATADGRVDHSASLGLEVIWTDVSLYGFVPQAEVVARRTWSNVDIYDRNEVLLGITAVSRF